MLKKRIIISLTFLNGVLFRTKKFRPDYRYTKNFIDLWNADEIILIDVSEKEKNISDDFANIIKFYIKNCHVPISVGGGINSLEKAKKVFDLGVEKIIINSSSYYNPDLTKNLVEIYGSSSIIHSIDFKKNSKNYYIYIDNGKKIIDDSVEKYIKKILSLGVGEILINNIDNDGSLMGFDLKLIKPLIKHLDLPIIIQGGAGNWSHFYDVFKMKKISGVCTQNIYHFTEPSLISLKKYLKSKKINVRYDD